jgi:hypothetical protein
MAECIESKEVEMSKAIYKYSIDAYDTEIQKIVMPVNHQLLTVQEQRGELVMWALVDLDTPSADVSVVVVVTREIFPDVGRPIEYVGTVQLLLSYVVHVFKVMP